MGNTEHRKEAEKEMARAGWTRRRRKVVHADGHEV